MRIAVFTDAYWPRVNGVTVSVYLYSHTLARIGHDVAVFCPHYPKSDMFKAEPEESGARAPQIIKVPSMYLIISKEDRLAKFTRIRWVIDQLDKFAPDILHINTEFTMAEFAFHYSRLRKLPVVYTFHTLWEEYITNYVPNFPPLFLRFVVRTVFRSFLKRVDMIIAPTKDAELKLNCCRRASTPSSLSGSKAKSSNSAPAWKRVIQPFAASGFCFTPGASPKKKTSAF